MNPRELRHLQRILRLVRQLRELRKLRESLRRNKQDSTETWLREHRREFSGLSDDDMAFIREQAQYDEQEWQEILRQLRETE